MAVLVRVPAVETHSSASDKLVHRDRVPEAALENKLLLSL
jgi:hypothetical protein